MGVKMKTNKEQLIKWESCHDMLDVGMAHILNDCRLLHWLDISKEFTGLRNEMFDSEVEEDSPQSNLDMVAVASAWEASIRVIAKLLGVESKALNEVVEKYTFHHKGDIPTIGADSLIKEVQDEKEFLSHLEGLNEF